MAATLPPEHPERAAVLAALTRDAARLRAIGERLSTAERERLWVWNRPRQFGIVTSWHYRLPEAVRIHAVHARHHARAISRIMPPP